MNTQEVEITDDEVQAIRENVVEGFQAGFRAPCGLDPRLQSSFDGHLY